MDTKKLKSSLLVADRWIRLLFMVLFAIVNYFVQIISWLIAAVQFIITIVAGKPNQNLLNLSEGLSGFSFHILKYLMYVTDEKPYPFSSWPGSEKK
ncbi:MAG: DUF4389 domain-containing protein [Gammaproteobacteria bacterium]|jgi:hypothetical protein